MSSGSAVAGSARLARGTEDGSPKSRRPKPELPPLTGRPAELEEDLKAWRAKRAKADAVPAYIVASNAVIRAVAERQPTSLEDLRRIPGIGPAKLDLYGDEILAVVAGDAS